MNNIQCKKWLQGISLPEIFVPIIFFTAFSTPAFLYIYFYFAENYFSVINFLYILSNADEVKSFLQQMNIDTPDQT